MVKDSSLHVGEIYHTRYGTPYKIIEYIGDGGKVKIEFLDNYKFQKVAEYKLARKCGVRNPYDKSLLGVGMIGLAETKVDKKEKESYKVWRRMITRCYSYTVQYSAYFDCEVSAHS